MKSILQEKYAIALGTCTSAQHRLPFIFVYVHSFIFLFSYDGLSAQMDKYFDVDVYATRLNFYRNGSDWKPYHHDSHAYGGR